MKWYVTTITKVSLLSHLPLHHDFFPQAIMDIDWGCFRGIAGYIYWHQIGCLSGTCAITSSPVNSTLYGAVMGGLLLSFFQKDKKEEQQKIPDND